MDTIQQAKAIFWEDARLEDLFRVAEKKGYTIDISSRSEHFKKSMRFYYWNMYRDFGDIDYNPTLPLLDQPSLPDILNLFK